MLKPDLRSKSLRWDLLLQVQFVARSGFSLTESLH